MIPSEIIEEIRNKADIIKIVEQYVKIRKRGKNYLGLCPFHSEKDPSFTVSPEKQLFHCFGCNEGGNVFSFIMKIENIGFAEAAEELGAKLGIAVPKRSGSGASKSEKDKYYQIMLLAAKYFKSCLEDKTGEAARSYLKQRGVTDKTKDLFGLGFALPGWDNLFKHLISRGVAPPLIERSGLILAREGKSGYYDRFRNRLIFPIIDHRNRVVAFGGRSLGDEEPKYLNSPDTLIYRKGETLYGLNLSKESIKKSKVAVLVEGNFDLITPFQSGVTNIAASMGTALTVYQCKLLSRYCDTIVLAFDADSAGGAAAERSVELLRSQGLKVKVAGLSGGKDPDNVVCNQGGEALKKCLTSALPFLEFKIKRILSRHNLKEIEARSRAMREVAGILSQEKDAFIQKEYAKLVASLLKTDTDTVLAEIKRNQHYQRGTRETLRRITKKPSSRLSEAEKNLIGLASQDKESLKIMKERVGAEDFSLPEAKAIAELLFAADIEEMENPSHFLLDNLADEGAKKFLSRILFSEHLAQADKKEKILDDCINVIKNEQLKNKIENLKLEIKEAEKLGQTEKVSELLSSLKSEIS
ncbi:MAG: DNA primase [Candidatus Margulisiibacteriota bacterium]